MLSASLFSGRVFAGGIYVEGDVKATPMPSGNTWSTTNSVFVGDQSSGLVRLSTGQQWNLTSADGHASHLGELPAATGTVEINGGVWNCGQELHCGYNGIGHILVDSSGIWTVGENAVAFGYASSASGSLDLKNGSWNSGTFGTYIGSAGRGEITVGPNGMWTSPSSVALGYESSGTGDVTLNGGRWNVSSGTVYVGHTGSGTATVNGGGVWNAAGREIHLGEFTNSIGTISLADSSTLSCAKMILGYSGDGDMTVSANSSFSAGNLYMGYYASGSADLVVSNQSHVTIATNLLVGVYGPGELTVSDNSLLETKITGIGGFEGNGRLYLLDNSAWISHGETFIGDGRGISSVWIDHSDWIIEKDVIFSGLLGNFIFLGEGNLSSPTHALIQMNWLDNITGSGTISNLTVSGGQIEVCPLNYSWGTGSLTLQNVSFVSTNRTDLELTVWADGSCDQIVFDDSVDFSGADIVIEFADDIAPPNGMEFSLFNYTGTGSSPLNVDNVTAPEGWALDPSGVFAEKVCKITSVAVDHAAQAAQLNFCVNPSGGDWVLQSTTNLLQPDWKNVHELTKCARSNLLSAAVTGDRRYWRMAKKEDAPPPPPPPQTPAGMVLIPAGTNSGTDPDFGAYSLTITNSFYMNATEITLGQYREVLSWAVTNGYQFYHWGSDSGPSITNHPVQMVNWYDCIKWCNARSEKDGKTPCYTVTGSTYKTGEIAPECNFDANGYRLPTSVEWEYAARGGLSGKRFPWGDTITHSQANYYSVSSVSYDISTTRGYHPSYFSSGSAAGTSPVGSFSPNGYGLFDMSGNVSEWCWDESEYGRIHRGGCFGSVYYTRCGIVEQWGPASRDKRIGFRSVCR